jgi:hypothetical protein
MNRLLQRGDDGGILFTGMEGDWQRCGNYNKTRCRIRERGMVMVNGRACKSEVLRLQRKQAP